MSILKTLSLVAAVLLPAACDSNNTSAAQRTDPLDKGSQKESPPNPDTGTQASPPNGSQSNNRSNQ